MVKGLSVSKKLGAHVAPEKINILAKLVSQGKPLRESF
jgi:hypothetical protein